MSTNLKQAGTGTVVAKPKEELKRNLKVSHMTMIAIGGAIGTGLFLASGASVSTASLALAAMSQVSSAINVITRDRALVGAYESQFSFSGQDISTNIQNITAAASVIMDADVASVKSSLSSSDVKTQASVAALTQAAQLPQELLRLIQS